MILALIDPEDLAKWAAVAFGKATATTPVELHVNAHGYQLRCRATEQPLLIEPLARDDPRRGS